MLTHYAWPGNLRELRNVLIRAASKARPRMIMPADLPDSMTRDAGNHAAGGPDEIAMTQREQLIRALESSNSVAEAATKLAVHFTTVYRRMRKYGVTPGTQRVPRPDR